MRNLFMNLVNSKNKICSCTGLGFHDVSDSKESACSAGDPGLFPGLGRSAGERVATGSRILWTEESGRQQSRESDMTERLTLA